ncbi:MAG: hypothetical protein M1823_003690 [Watsoniomyces obsoletus]|nr:MAG: hypothetical protein M1823_003690 [Watsoniomyces obsoletus]
MASSHVLQSPRWSSEHRARVLFIEAYDSYSYSIVSLLLERLPVEVEVLKIDDDLHFEDFVAFVRRFDAIVAGPGPGNPTNPQDVGLMDWIWRLPEKDLRPTLGVCLGLQSLAYSFGAGIERLKEPTHGIVSPIVHQERSIFKGVKGLRVTRYHSLCARLDLEEESQATEPIWHPTTTCPELEPLAWAVDGRQNGAVLMAVQHVKKPFWALQYHPESICSNDASFMVIDNWWAEVVQWHSKNMPHRQTSSLQPNGDGRKRIKQLHLDHFHATPNGVSDHPRRIPSKGFNKGTVLTRTVQMSGKLEQRLYDNLKLGGDGSELVFLDSAVLRRDTGLYSIIGFIEDAERIDYRVELGEIRRWKPSTACQTHKVTSINKVWPYLDEYLQTKQAVGGNPEAPFWGGLVGYLSYELGLSTIDVQPSPGKDFNRAPPDMMFVFVERSLVIDHRRDRVYIQSIRPDDEQWLEEMEDRIHSVLAEPPLNGKKVNGYHHRRPTSSDIKTLQAKKGIRLTVPDAEGYIDRVRQCQEYIRAGESYELCLTDQATLKIPRPNHQGSTWALYKRLRARNPAPFGAYFKLGPLTILSCSPERFLHWDRDAHFQMRPIKGTVSKEGGVTYEEAERILKTPKEQAENLMIVDLIRHDMHGVLGAGNVKVTSLMQVEEYEKVYQLVSVIEGQGTLPNAPKHSNTNYPNTALAPEQPQTNGHYHPMNPVPHTNGISHTNDDNENGHDQNIFHQGLQLLSASLPPGSMTGAPKKRSCHLLESLERHQRRGIYSGVFGYLCVGGSGDFSVMIRSAVNWHTGVEDDNNGRVGDFTGGVGTRGGEEEEGSQTWTFGAGGAVTALSDPEAEYDEMEVKLRSTLSAFVDCLSVD